jgi:hypothetical protein
LFLGFESLKLFVEIELFTMEVFDVFFFFEQDLTDLLLVGFVMEKVEEDFF